MGRTYEVGAGETRLAYAEDTLVARGVGSCVVVILYDRVRQIGAMAHPMLPKRTMHTIAEICDYYPYVDDAIARLVHHLEECGASCAGLEARIVGGADMFAQGSTTARQGIGPANVCSAQEVLAKRGIQIVEQFTGGTSGRSASFCVGTGILEMRQY